MLTSASLSMAHYKSLHLSCPVESEEARGGIDGPRKRAPSRSAGTKVGAAETVSSRARFKCRGERYLRVKVIACRKQRTYQSRRVAEPARWQLVVIRRRGTLERHRTQNPMSESRIACSQSTERRRKIRARKNVTEKAQLNRASSVPRSL